MVEVIEQLEAVVFSLELHVFPVLDVVVVVVEGPLISGCSAVVLFTCHIDVAVGLVDLSDSFALSMQGVQGQQPKPFTEADVVTNERFEEVFSCALQVTEL